MPSRRQFLLSSLPLLAPLPGLAFAGAPGTRAALVIGNGRYATAPLANPENDARAMSGLLRTAGFATDLYIDCARAEMFEAIARFGRTAAADKAEVLLFYYAGHGAQLEWRNYLLPVDARAGSAGELKTACIDLGVVIELFAGLAGRGKTFVVILDACRDDPFAGAFRPERRGLSQFDAPPGSLLAYATSPGATASDGDGRHGLYTEHLVRELSVPGVGIEDALKRVRLGVRLASRGAQVPWESTSLEQGLFFFPAARESLSAEETERRFAEELALWGRIKQSSRLEDWLDYLHRYPGGRFAEIAQARLARLLPSPGAVAAPAPATPPESSGQLEAAAVPVAPAVQPDRSDAPVQVPHLPAASANPYSAGRYPLGRRFTVGDRAVLRDSDLLTGLVEGERILRVTRVDELADRIEMENGAWIFDGMGNPVETPLFRASVPQQLVPAELQVGVRWQLRFALERKEGRQAGESATELTARVAARETVRCPAGEFSAFRIEASGWASGPRGNVGLEIRQWVVPGLNFAVRSERIRRLGNRLLETRLTELVAIRQAANALPAEAG